MAKKRRFRGLILVLLLLAGVAAGGVLYLGPDKTRQTWQSLTGRFKGLAAQPVQRPSDAALAPAQPPIAPGAGKAASSNPIGSAPEVKAPITDLPLVSKSPGGTKPNHKPPVTIAQAPAKPAGPTKSTGVADVPTPVVMDDGDLLAQRLSPPVRVSVAPTPYVSEPHGRPATDDFVPPLGRVPPALQAPAPVLAAERRPAQRGEAALDRPPLPADLDPARPERRLWPAEAPAYSAAPRAEAVPALRYVGLPPADAATPQEDATGDASRLTMLAGTSIPAPSPPPFLKLTIPDPFEVPRVVQLANPPAEQDPPQPSFQRPPPPRLPDEPKKK